MYGITADKAVMTMLQESVVVAWSNTCYLAHRCSASVSACLAAAKRKSGGQMTGNCSCCSSHRCNCTDKHLHQAAHASKQRVHIYRRVHLERRNLGTCRNLASHWTREFNSFATKHFLGRWVPTCSGCQMQETYTIVSSMVPTHIRPETETAGSQFSGP
jgi:hypothetical protein